MIDLIEDEQNRPTDRVKFLIENIKDTLLWISCCTDTVFYRSNSVDEIDCNLI